jgi:hypothetical protein
MRLADRTAFLARTPRNCKLDGTKYVPSREVWWGKLDLRSSLADSRPLVREAGQAGPLLV